MQIQIKRRFIIALDEDEAEEFLDDATPVQQRVRDQMRSNSQQEGHKAAVSAPVTRPAPPVPTKRGRPAHAAASPKALPKGNRRKPAPVNCPDCGEPVDPRVLWRHKAKHERASAAHGADGQSPE